MIDNSYTIKEASKLLDCSTQNIYRQKNILISQGLMIQNEVGSYYITQKGIEFLKEKRIDTMRTTNQGLPSVDNKDLQTIATPTTNNSLNDYINSLKEQIQDLKNEKEYWKNEYTKKDNELAVKNEYIQELSTKAFALLGTQEDNKRQAEETKKGFFHRFFS